MKTRAIILSALIVVIELAILWGSFQVSDLDEVKYALASRYSARISLLIFEGALLWIGLIGLKKIYSQESTRQWLVILLLLFAVNHVMHFFFLYANHAVNDLVLFTSRTAGGMIGYVIIVVAPVLIWNKTQLTPKLYGGILISLLFVDVIALVSYLGRWNKDLPMASSKETYLGIMLFIGLVLIMNVYRIFAERKVTVKTIDN